MSAKHEVRLGADLAVPLKVGEAATLSADFYHHADDPIDVVAFVQSRANGPLVRSDPVSIEPKTWRRAVEFTFSRKQLRKATVGKQAEFRAIGFALSPKAKVRDTFLVDTITLARKPAPPPAGK